jgi:hypothetical protein
MDRSTRADVIDFLGQPDVERRGVEYDSTPYLALGYGCSVKPDGEAFPVLETAGTGRTGPYCKTVFWMNRRTGKLGDFYTSSVKYSEGHGVRIGMKTAAAERLVNTRAGVGCGEGIYLGRPNHTLTIALGGGDERSVGVSLPLRLVGGHVYAFALHGQRSDIGVFDCL